MNDVYLGIGAIVWFLIFVLLIFFGILAILMPWFVYKIRLEVREIKTHLLDMEKSVADLPGLIEAEMAVGINRSTDIPLQKDEEEMPITGPDVSHENAEKEISSTDLDDDLQYAPPQLRK